MDMKSVAGAFALTGLTFCRRPLALWATKQQEIEASVGHMLEAFAVGTPPHGGIALGVDRQIMLLTGETSLKEAIAFPMSSTGRTSVMDAPSPIDQISWKNLG